MEGNMVYLDYAATTPFNKEVIKTHEQLLQKYFIMRIVFTVKELKLIVCWKNQEVLLQVCYM